MNEYSRSVIHCMMWIIYLGIGNMMVFHLQLFPFLVLVAGVFLAVTIHRAGVAGKMLTLSEDFIEAVDLCLTRMKKDRQITKKIVDDFKVLRKKVLVVEKESDHAGMKKDPVQ